ncbi:S41 family peptidase [Luteimonas sp. Y-2-2-4F]|nr:S41 family peptidase [Luteimonas sp. Y-2-2-4F]MCD9032007.1 S41 family peptidase [Luteimonas sp. Y-2-2-4F]
MRLVPPASACLALAALLALALPAHAAPPAPREVAGRVADAVAARYWDPAAGERIGDALRERAAAGAFDGFDDPRELASALGDALRPHDAHFRVAWTPPGTADTGAAPPAWSPERAALRDLRSGHGIRRVERLPGNVGLLELDRFVDFDERDPQAPARLAIDAALRLLAGADALLIDVRGNGGGSTAMVGYLASAFVPAGADVYNTFRRRGGTSSEAPAIPHPAPDLARPLYVLASARTASAAESFAYTLQQAGRARVVGEASAGAANPGGMVPAGGGFEVFVSDGSPRNPRSGRNWEGTGVRPDEAADADGALALAHRRALERVLPSLAAPAAEEARWVIEALAAPPAPPAPAWRAYAGRYGDTEVRLDDTGLALRQGGRPARRLRALGADRFAFADDPAARVRFLHGDGGRVQALEVLDAWGGQRRLRRDP